MSRDWRCHPRTSVVVKWVNDDVREIKRSLLVLGIQRPVARRTGRLASTRLPTLRLDDRHQKRLAVGVTPPKIGDRSTRFSSNVLSKKPYDWGAPKALHPLDSLL
jgi:hypothetical protein